MTGQNVLQLFDGGVVAAGGPVDACQCHLSCGHLRVESARSLGLPLRFGERFPVTVSMKNLPQRLAEADMREREVRRDPQRLAEVLGSGIRTAGVVRGIEKALTRDEVIVGQVRPVSILCA